MFFTLLIVTNIDFGYALMVWCSVCLFGVKTCHGEFYLSILLIVRFITRSLQNILRPIMTFFKSIFSNIKHIISLQRAMRCLHSRVLETEDP